MDLLTEDVEYRNSGMKKESQDPWIPNFTSVPFRDKTFSGNSNLYEMDVPSPILTIDLQSSPLDTETSTPLTRMNTPQKGAHDSIKCNTPENFSSSISSGISPIEENGKWSNPALSNALRDRHKKDSGSGSRSRLRTPRTLTRLMQQHRENERHRHRGLNATIKEISNRIPGYEEAANETKIVKLQRIINYICHLEEHIQSVCGDIGLDLDFKHLFLSPNIQKPPEPKRQAAVASQPSAGINDVTSTVSTPKKAKCIASSAQAKEKSQIQKERTECRRGLKISSPTVDSTTVELGCKRGRSQRRCQRARNLKEACCSAAAARTGSKPQEGQGEHDSDAALEEVCQVLQQAGNITPEIEKSLEWLGHIAASPDSSLLFSEDYNLNNADLQHGLPEEHALEILNLGSFDWMKNTEPLTDVKKDAELECSIMSIHSYARSTCGEASARYGPQPMWNCDPRTLRHGQVIKLEAQRKAEPPDVIYISDSLEYDTDSQGSVICQFPENMEVAEQCEISDSPLSPARSEGGHSLDFNMMGNLRRSKCQITAISPVSYNCTVERNKRKASTPQRRLPFAMYSMVVETDSSGSYQSLSDEDNITHCQFQGIQCLEENRILQKQKVTEEELAFAAEAAAAELDEADIAEAMTALQVPPFDRLDLGGFSAAVSPPASAPLAKRRRRSSRNENIIDHRKTSWMNGFMMYSRIHRREYIERNPGVHTSFISKLMGQDWRKLTLEEQQPYRQQAKEYVRNYLAPFNTPFDFDNDL